MDAEAIERDQSQLHMATNTLDEFILSEARRAKLDQEGVMCWGSPTSTPWRGGPRGNIGSDKIGRVRRNDLETDQVSRKSCSLRVILRDGSVDALPICPPSPEKATADLSVKKPTIVHSVPVAPLAGRLGRLFLLMNHGTKPHGFCLLIRVLNLRMGRIIKALSFSRRWERAGDQKSGANPK